MVMIRVALAIFVGYLLLPLLDMPLRSREFLYLVLGISVVLQFNALYREYRGPE